MAWPKEIKSIYFYPSQSQYVTTEPGRALQSLRHPYRLGQQTREKRRNTGQGSSLVTNNTCYLTYCFYITHSYIPLECEDLRVGFGRLYLSRSQHVIMFQSNTREPRLLDWDSPSKIKASTPEQVRSSPSLHVSNHTQVVLVPPNSSLNLMEQVAQLHENHQACH